MWRLSSGWPNSVIKAGKNLTLEFVHASSIEGFEAGYKELAGRKVDIILASGPEISLKSALAAAGTLPIVMIAIDYDPFARGYVASLARPSGNVTGVFFQQIELSMKRIQLFMDTLPNLRGAAVFWDAISADQWQATQSAGQRLGLRLAGIELREPPYDYERALARLAPDDRGGLISMTSPFFFRERERLADFALHNGMATMFGFREYVAAGGLLSYGPSITGMYRRAADYVDRIAKGAKPSELPIEQPTKFELVINLKTARALGLEVPPSLLARADEDPGWQLSFAAVVAIMLLAAPIAERIRRRLPAALAEAAALTVAATIGTAPLIALHFEQTSLFSLPANVLAAPAVAPVMWLGMAAVTVGQLSTAAALPFTAVAGYPLAFVAWVGATAAHLPHAAITVSPGSSRWPASALSWRSRRPRRADLARSWWSGSWPSHSSSSGRPRGPSRRPRDCASRSSTSVRATPRCIQDRRTSVLVDTGPPDGGVVARLRRAGVRRLDLLVVTHAQADHDGGAAAVLRAMPVGMLLDGRDGVREPLGLRMAAEARRRRVAVAVPEAGQTLRAGGIELRVLSPPARRRTSTRARTPTTARSSPRPASAASGCCSPPTRSPTSSRTSTSSPSTC